MSKWIGLIAAAWLAVAVASEPGIIDETAEPPALMEAVQRGDISACLELIDKGADVDEVFEEMTPLKEAASQGRADICRLLLAEGATVDYSPGFESLSALHLAAMSGNPECCRVLLDAGADVNGRTRTGSTPLHLAMPDIEMCRHLIAAGADVNATNRWDETPLFALFQDLCEEPEEKLLALVKMLLSAGADKDAVRETSLRTITLQSLAEQLEYPSITKLMAEAPAVAKFPHTHPALFQLIDGSYGVLAIYHPQAGKKLIWSDTSTLQRFSPCSTFKIAVAIIALECGVISPGDSTRAWSGKKYWNADWNKDQDLKSAMRSSCVWYFRKLVDEIGQERMQAELQKLGYGNADISDWEGKLSPGGASAATGCEDNELRGFWLNSSLMISPLEQVEVMERIFGPNSSFSAANLAVLKEATLAHEDAAAGIRIYGKTGTSGKPEQAMHGWFTGFAETPAGPLYFCLYLGRGIIYETDDLLISGPIARDLALPLILRYCAGELKQ